jgi:hypothetical protein
VADNVNPDGPARGVTSAGDIRLLTEALQDAFARVEELLPLLSRFGLPDVSGKLPARSDASGRRELATTTSVMVSIAAADRWLAPLVLAARRARPENLKLWRFATHAGLTPRGYPEAGDEAELAAAVEPAIRASELRRRLTIFEGQVCSIQVEGGAQTTGLLVGPDLVLTSATLFGGDEAHEPDSGALAGMTPRVSVLFDRWVAGKDADVQGVECRLAANGLLAYSGAVAGSTPGLAYALLRLDRPVGEAAGAQWDRRGWMALTRSGGIQPARLVSTLRFDSNRSLQFSYSPTGMRDLDAKAARVRYVLEGDQGGAGAPVFDAGFSVIALHLSRTSGGPWFPNIYRTRREREGVAVEAIVRDLASRGISLPDPRPPQSTSAR